MNELMIRETVLDSREVAVMMNMEHAKVLRNIKRHVDYFNEAKSGLVKNEGIGKTKNGLSEYFIETSYKSEQNKDLPCYLVTRKGCELLANKMTGKKGHDFSIAYIDRFHQMEGYIKGEITINQLMIPIKNQIKELTQQSIEEIRQETLNYFRPTHEHKLNINSYIKRRMFPCSIHDVELVKDRFLFCVGASKWEDVPVYVLRSNMKLLDECIDVIKADKDRQLSFLEF